MGEEANQGITRRDLLRRGAVLGGAVVWTTPVVQTLGMGRAFAQQASPIEDGEKEISYVGINVICDDHSFFVKWEEGDGWEMDPGAAPFCAPKESLPDGVKGDSLGFEFDLRPDNEACGWLTIPSSINALGIEIDDLAEECDVTVWVMAGAECRTYTEDQLNIGSETLICSPAA